ncbi:MAG: Holliday junction branch migration protein RuvA [Candidatus Hydrogenedentota bacterium]|nr:MAG: Holliday junction branch migration protein RuvA [Candidatus Hydrogenedentota bacterium]
MIYQLQGQIVELDPLFLLLNVNGVSYGMKIPMTAYEVFKAKKDRGEILQVHTRLVFQNEALQLYGFSSNLQAMLFDFLRSLSGIGPAMAMNLLSTIPAENLVSALLQQNEALLVKTPGIGKAKAKKILFEAEQKKIQLEKFKENLSMPAETSFLSIEQDTKSKLVAALKQLGFQQKEIDLAFAKLQKQKELPQADSPLEEWIRTFLRVI